MSGIKDIRVDWVSLVDRAAVRDPSNKSEPRRFLLTKREGADVPSESYSDGGEIMPDITKAQQEAVNEAVQKALAPVLEQIAKLGPAGTGEGPPNSKEDRFVGDGDLDTENNLGELRKAGPVGTGGSSEEESEGAETQKSESPEVAELLKAERARIAKLEQDLEAERLVRKAERDEAAEQAAIRKAEQEYSSLSADPKELGPVLKAAQDALSAEQFGVLEGVLTAAQNTVSSSNLFKEAGVRRGATQANKAETDLLQKAEEIEAAEPGIKKSAAMEKAIRQNPELAAQHSREARGGAGPERTR